MGAHHGRPSRILVIDDNPTMRLLAREALEPEGFDVVDAANGSDALGLMV